MPEISEDTRSIGIFCVNLDIEMARKAGWSNEDIATVWEEVSAVGRAAVKRVAQRHGYTRQCPDCECWTVPDGPCHRCTWYHRRSLASHLLQGWHSAHQLGPVCLGMSLEAFAEWSGRTKAELLKLGMVYNNETDQYEWPDDPR